jgi:hypothetical protein
MEGRPTAPIFTGQHSPEERAALIAYYQNPEIRWFEAGYGSDGGVRGGPLKEAGFYVLAHCGRPECCRPDGPFESESEARDWSVRNQVSEIK